MKIIHVITSLRTGGAEKLMVDLLPRLRENGEDVELVVFDGIRTPFFEAFEKTGIPMHVLNTGKSVYDIRNLFALRKYIKRADIVHSHNTAPQLFAALANIGLGKMLITTEHNTTNRRRDIPILKPVDRWMYRQYARIICISEKAEENLRLYLKDHSDKIITVFNGIDTSRFNIPYVEKRDQSQLVITMVAAFREQKDQMTLIKSMLLLPDSYLLQLVGVKSGHKYEECRKYVEDHGLDGKVLFLGQRTDIPVLLSESDVVVLSSHYEGLSLSSIEGMASGRPFIASDVDGLHEIVEGYGILVPHKDASAMADAILQVTQNEEYALQVAKRCQERALKYDISKMAERYCNIYKNLVFDRNGK